VIAVQEAHLPGANTILLTTYLTIGLSVLAHGITAAPLASRYADWYESHPGDHRPVMESTAAANIAPAEPFAAISPRELGILRIIPRTSGASCVRFLPFLSSSSSSLFHSIGRVAG